MNNDNTLIPKYRFREFKNDSYINTSLSDFSYIIMGSSPSSTSYNENGLGLPLIQGNADIKKRFSAPRIFTTEITKECNKEDILLSVRAPVGTVAKSLHHACIGRGIAALRSKKNNSQEYLYQWLLSYEAKWGNISQGGTFDAVNSNEIKNLILPVPSNPVEQQKIAACLSSLDDVIAEHEEKLTALEEHKKGLMQNLFPQEGETQPKYCFPEFENDGDWMENVLDDVFNFVRGPFGGALKKDIFVKEGYAVYEQSHAIYSDFSEFRYYINSDKYKELIRFSVKPNDLIMSCSGTMGKFALVPENCSEGVINQALLKLSAKKGYSILYLKYLMETDLYQNKLLSQSAGGAIKNVVGVSEIKLIKIYLPKTLVEQQKIATVLSSVDELIVAQREKIASLKEHKKGLMQGLFPKIES